MQADLFGKGPPQPPVQVFYEWLERADDVFGWLRDHLPWEQHVFREATLMPRLECWFGPTGSTYSYSGETYQAHELVGHPLKRLLAKVNDQLDPVEPRNAVFCNLYRTGQDSIGWHTDDEPVLGPVEQVVIASLSLGDRRTFAMKHRGSGHRVDWQLGHGDLLVMGPGSQSGWLHEAPKTTKPVGPRISLTFRRIYPRRP